jgi:hypothetical protein
MVAMQEINTANIDILIMTEFVGRIGKPPSELACTGGPRAATAPVSFGGLA